MKRLLKPLFFIFSCNPLTPAATEKPSSLSYELVDNDHESDEESDNVAFEDLLTNLPNELLVLITYYLDLDDLKALAHVNRKMRAFTHDFLVIKNSILHGYSHLSREELMQLFLDYCRKNSRSKSTPRKAKLLVPSLDFKKLVSILPAQRSPRVSPTSSSSSSPRLSSSWDSNNDSAQPEYTPQTLSLFDLYSPRHNQRPDKTEEELSLLARPRRRKHCKKATRSSHSTWGSTSQ
ncbi:F-box protein [Candidatus Babeliales bacterium]|nr:F-box protein [Candidatus Babeliales bacterium]